MIDPLRFNEEHCPVYAMERPVFCEMCKFTRAKKNNPNVADKYCPKCTQKQFLCSECDHQAHRVGPLRLHMRRIIVLGHGVRKITKVRGDGKNFPLPMDTVEVMLESKIYHEGKEINREPPRKYRFMAGLSGLTMHVQVLGAKNLVSADLSGTSDPFVKASYSGKTLGTTRVRPRALNPKWDNETFLVPMDPGLPEPRRVSNSQKDVFRLEVYDYDWLGGNDMLGIVELSRSKLKKLASIAGSTPIVLPLTLSEFHGIVGVQLGLCRRYVHIKVVRGEALDSADLFGASDPYAKVHMRGWFMGKTPSVQDTNDPVWTEGNVFHVKINDLLREERKLLLQKRQRELRDASDATEGAKRGDVGIDTEANAKDTGDDSIFTLELFDENKFARHVSLGVAKMDVDILRVMLPQLPTAYVPELPYPASGAQRAQAAKALSVAKPVALKKGMSSRLFSMKSMRGAALLADDASNSDDSLASDVDLADLYDSEKVRYEEYDPVLMHLSKALDDRTSDGETSDTQSRRNRFSKSSSRNSPQQSPGQTPLGLSPSQSPFQTHLNTPAGSRLGSPNATPRLSLTSSNLEKLGNKSLQERVGTMYSEYLDESHIDKKVEHLQSTIKAIQERGEEGEGGGRARTISFEDDDGKQQAAGVAVSPTATGSGSPGANKSDIDEITQALKAELEDLLARRQAQGPRMTAIAEEPSFVERTVSLPMTKRMDDFSDSDEEEEDAGALLEAKAKPAPGVGMLSKLGRGISSGALLGKGMSSGALLSRGMSSGALLGRGISSGALLSRGMSSGALLSRGMSSGALLGLGKDADEEVDPVEWSKIRHFNVEQLSQDNVARPEVKNRGFLVVRLLSASRGNVIAGLDEGVRAMTVGETAQLKVRFDYAYGHYCMGGNIPPRANIIFDVKLLRLNGYGRLGMPIRQARRFLRLFIRMWKAAKRTYNSCRRYMTDRKPLKRCLRSFLRLFGSSAALGSDSASLVEGRSLVYDEVEESEEEEEEEEDSAQAAQAILEVKIDPKMKRLVNPAVKAGSKYLFGWQPEKRIVRSAPVRMGRRAPRPTDGEDDVEAQGQAEGSVMDGTSQHEEQEEQEEGSYDPDAPHERRRASSQEEQELAQLGSPGPDHRQAFVEQPHGHAPPEQEG